LIASYRSAAGKPSYQIRQVNGSAFSQFSLEDGCVFTYIFSGSFRRRAARLLLLVVVIVVVVVVVVVVQLG
jgi:hypothetical protein